MIKHGRAIRREQLRELAQNRGLNGILLRTAPNFFWYTGGADNRVDHSAPSGVAEVLVTPQSEYVITSSIEAPRIQEEATPDIEVLSYPWYESNGELLQRLLGSGRLGSDLSDTGSVNIANSVQPLRFVLDAAAVEQYRQVGRLTAEAMEETAASLTPGMQEFEAVAILEAACFRRGMYAPVVMAAGDDRIIRHRHAIPMHDRRFYRRVMLVVCAERWGLYANLTRFVNFEEPDVETQHRMELCQTILRRLREEATRPGQTLAGAFDECKQFYADAGFADEWKLHHQGGMTGYATREIVATPETKYPIAIGQAFAWNPSITGAKTEETFVLTETGPEILTSTQ